MASGAVGRYEIIRELGQGGMGVVYLAYDPSVQRQVAVKVISSQFAHDSRFRGRLEREARLIAALEHPYIVPIYDYGEDNEQPYIVMRYLPGGTLGDRIAKQPMSLDEAVPIIERLASALDEAHRHEIIHRDLKPTNVLFDARGDAFLSDFGIAKTQPTTVTTTVESTYRFYTTDQIGTPAYMSPEQLLGDIPLDARSDVYSLGVMVYEMLTGLQPYAGDTPVRLILKRVNEPPPPIDVGRLGLPRDCDAVLARAMANRVEARFATAGEFSEALGALLVPSDRVARGSLPHKRLAQAAPGLAADVESPATVPGVGALATGPAERPTRPARVQPLLAGVIALLLLFGLTIGVGLTGGLRFAFTPTPTQGASTRAAPSLTLALVVTPTVVARPTLTPSSTASPSATSTATPSATLTPEPPTPTFTATRRPATRVPPTPTPLPTDTPLPPPTDTPAPPPPPPDTPVPPTPTPAPP